MDGNRARDLLQARRAEVERALVDLSQRAEDDDVHRFEPGDAGSDLFEDELSEGLAERLRGELDAIERAEKRLMEGTYGLSVESGAPIPDGRLEAIPWAERTAEEQARFDRG